MEILGYAAAVVIGISLGLIGAGGSILTIPVLVYLMGIAPVNATSYSLFIVAISAFTGVLGYLRHGLVSLPTVLLFGLPSVLGVFISRKYLLHAIPEDLFDIGSLHVTRNGFLMMLLAVLMVIASYSMIRKMPSIRVNAHADRHYHNFLIFQQGIVVGVVVGLVGAGGGFLIIPALIMLARLPMKKAIGTSLAIVALNSTIGFLSDFGVHQFDWRFLLVFSGFAISGIVAGSYISKFVSGTQLKPAFGWFILAMGVIIFGQELFSGMGAY
jgi:uncharacterized membrane protein YfcA